MAAVDQFAPTLVCYHGGCPDGTCAAWAVWQHHPAARYVGCRAGERPLCEFEGQRVLFVDLSPARGYADELAEKAAAVLVLDHHETAEWLAGDPRFVAILDRRRAGCQLAWDYYNPGQPRPWFIDYVADRDLWAWGLPGSKEVNTAMYERGCTRTIEDVARFHALSLTQPGDVLPRTLRLEGQMLLAARERAVAAEVRRATRCTFAVGGVVHSIWLSACPPDLRSDVGNDLLRREFEDGGAPAFAATYVYSFADNAWWISLRSDDTRTSVEAIAVAFGGGGHRNAAGFTLGCPNLRSPGSPFGPM